MKCFLTFFLVLTFTACTDNTKSKDPLIEQFIELTKGSDKMKISYEDVRIGAKQTIDTIITSQREINLMKQWIQESSKSDTCYKLTGTVSFIKGDNEFLINFGLSPECPSFYYFIEGKPVTFKMPYQGSMYLGELLKRH